MLFSSYPKIKNIFFLACILGVIFSAGSTAGARELSVDPDSDSPAADIKSFTLKDSVLYALEKNPSLKASEFEIKKSASDIGVARSGFLPTLSANYDYSDLNSLYADGPTDADYLDQITDTFSLQASQTLFAGLTILNSYQKAKLGEELARVKKDSQEMRLVLDVQTHFMRYQKARLDVSSMKDTVKRLKMNVQAARSFFEQKMVPFVQVLQAETDLADARQRMNKARDEVKKEYDMLNRYLHLSQESNAEYRGDLKKNIQGMKAGLEQCLQVALNKRPEMEVARKSLAMAEKETDIRVGRFLPRLKLNGNYYARKRDYEEHGVSYGQSYDRDQHNEYWTVGIQVQWPFFEGGKKGYEYARAGHEVSRLRQQMLSTRDEIISQVRTYYTLLRNADERIALTKEEIKEARENYERAGKRYFMELGTQTDLLNAQIRLTRANMNHNQALLDFQVAFARLHYAMGVKNYSLEARDIGE